MPKRDSQVVKVTAMSHSELVKQYRKVLIRTYGCCPDGVLTQIREMDAPKLIRDLEILKTYPDKVTE